MLARMVAVSFLVTGRALPTAFFAPSARDKT
jgi:hypothetical protein